MSGADDDFMITGASMDTRGVTPQEIARDGLVPLGNFTWADNVDAINPSLKVMLAEMGREISAKRGNGNCFMLSASEAVGLMPPSFDNQLASNEMRKNLGRTIRENLPTFLNDLVEMPPRPDDAHRAMDASMIAQMIDPSGNRDTRGENRYMDYWIRNNIENDQAWTDNQVGGMALAMRYNCHVVIMYLDVREKIPTMENGQQKYRWDNRNVRHPVFTWGGFLRGSNMMLIHPNGHRQFMPFDRLCSKFPTGPERNALKVLFYNGNMGDPGNHFEHAILKPVASTGGASGASASRASAPTDSLCRNFEILLSPNQTTSLKVPRNATPEGEDKYQEQIRRGGNNKIMGKARQKLFATESAPECSKASRMTQHFPSTSNPFAALEKLQEVDVEMEVEPKEKLDAYTRTDTIYTPKKGNCVQVILKTTPPRETNAQRKARNNVNANRKYRGKAALLKQSKGKSKVKSKETNYRKSLDSNTVKAVERMSQNQAKETNRKKSLESNTEKAADRMSQNQTKASNYRTSLDSNPEKAAERKRQNQRFEGKRKEKMAIDKEYHEKRLKILRDAHDKYQDKLKNCPDAQAARQNQLRVHEANRLSKRKATQGATEFQRQINEAKARVEHTQR